MKALNISLIVLTCFVIFVSGCVSQTTELGACEGIEDTCALFACSVENCWCDDTSPDGAILLEGTGVVASTGDATNVVTEYLTDQGTIGEHDVVNTVKLNEYFYNVFVENENSEEVVFTVSHTGAILKALCGV
jgi:hypothetical protein